MLQRPYGSLADVRQELLEAIQEADGLIKDRHEKGLGCASKLKSQLSHSIQHAVASPAQAFKHASEKVSTMKSDMAERMSQLPDMKQSVGAILKKRDDKNEERRNSRGWFKIFFLFECFEKSSKLYDIDGFEKIF